jgi:hypothetical protein
MRCERGHAGFSLSGSASLIAMVRTANFREGNDIAGRGRLYQTRPWTVLVERKMRSGVTMIHALHDDEDDAGLLIIEARQQRVRKRPA